MTSATQSAKEVLDREYLTARAKLIDLAAFLDRIDRAGGCDDPRLETIRDGLGIVASAVSDRTEQIQLLFSLPHQDDWRQECDV